MEHLDNQIRYSTTILGKKDKYISADEYEAECLNSNYNCYEYLPTDDNIKVKPHFDIEIKPEYCEEGEEYKNSTQAVLDIAILEIKKHFPEARWGIKDSSSESYIAKDKDGEYESWKESLHIIIPNYKITRSNCLSIVNDMNEAIRKEKKMAGIYKIKDEIETPFFDNSIYKGERKMRSPYANKQYWQKGEKIFTENRPFQIIEGTFNDCLITACFHEDVIEFSALENYCSSPNSITSITDEPKKKKQKTKPKIIIEEDKPTELTQNQELLLIPLSNLDRKKWINVCSCLKFNEMTNDDWLLFCKTNNLNMDTEKIELFKNIKTDSALEIYYLQGLVKKGNPVEYQKWKDKWRNYFISIEDLKVPSKCAEKIKSGLKRNLVLCKENWYMKTENNLWKQQKEPSYYIIKELTKYIDYSQLQLATKISETDGEEKEKWIEIQKIYLSSYAKIESSGFISIIIKCCKTLLADDNFDSKLDANSGKFAFQNGILNLETLEFKEGIDAFDYIKNTIPHDYVLPNKKKMEYLKNEVLLKIMNNNTEHLEYFLSLIGYTYIGSPNLEKSIYFCIDKTMKSAGDNGKTFWFDILSHVLPNYTYGTQSTFLELGNAKIHKQLAMMKGIRMLWMDEFSKKKTNAVLIKKIADGLGIENEIMYGTSEIMTILFKAWILTNHLPNIDPEETAVFNRAKQISYGSHFDRTGEREEEEPNKLLFIADTTLPTKIKTEYINEVIGLVIEYANKYYNSGIPPIPQQFKNDVKETQAANDLFGEWFNDNIKEKEFSELPLDLIIKQTGMKKEMVKDSMKRKGFIYKKDLTGMGKDNYNKYYKGGYEGICYDEPIEDDTN